MELWKYSVGASMLLMWIIWQFFLSYLYFFNWIGMNRSFLNKTGEHKKKWNEWAQSQLKHKKSEIHFPAWKAWFIYLRFYKCPLLKVIQLCLKAFSSKWRGLSFCEGISFHALTQVNSLLCKPEKLVLVIQGRQDGRIRRRNQPCISICCCLNIFSPQR